MQIRDKVKEQLSIWAPKLIKLAQEYTQQLLAVIIKGMVEMIQLKAPAGALYDVQLGEDGPGGFLLSGAVKALKLAIRAFSGTMAACAKSTTCRTNVNTALVPVREISEVHAHHVHQNFTRHIICNTDVACKQQCILSAGMQLEFFRCEWQQISTFAGPDSGKKAS